MNAITPIITPAETEARELAFDVLAGKYDSNRGPFGRGGFYTATDWRKSAQYAVDTDDLSELVFMLADERSIEAANCTGWFGDDERRLDDLFYCEVMA